MPSLPSVNVWMHLELNVRKQECDLFGAYVFVCIIKETWEIEGIPGKLRTPRFVACPLISTSSDAAAALARIDKITAIEIASILPLVMCPLYLIH